MVTKFNYYFDEEDIEFEYEVEEERFMDLLVEKFMDQFNIGDEVSARDLIYRFVGWDSITDTYGCIVEEELKEEAYEKFTKNTLDKICGFLPDRKTFNPSEYEKLLGFKVPFEGEIWTMLEIKLDRNNINYETNEDTQTLTIKE
jgi:hypothetical protein